MYTREFPPRNINYSIHVSWLGDVVVNSASLLYRCWVDRQTQPKCSPEQKRASVPSRLCMFRRLFELVSRISDIKHNALIIYMIFTFKLFFSHSDINFKLKNVRHNKGETRPLRRISPGVRPLWPVPLLQSYSHLEVWMIFHT